MEDTSGFRNGARGESSFRRHLPGVCGWRLPPAPLPNRATPRLQGLPRVTRRWRGATPCWEGFGRVSPGKHGGRGPGDIQGGRPPCSRCVRALGDEAYVFPSDVGRDNGCHSTAVGCRERFTEKTTAFARGGGARRLGRMVPRPRHPLPLCPLPILFQFHPSIVGCQRGCAASSLSAIYWLSPLSARDHRPGCRGVGHRLGQALRGSVGRS